MEERAIVLGVGNPISINIFVATISNAIYIVISLVGICSGWTIISLQSLAAIGNTISIFVACKVNNTKPSTHLIFVCCSNAL